jgi:hypothetical protein
MARARHCTDKEEKLETLLISTSQVGVGLVRAHLQKLTVCQLLLAVGKLLFAICQEAAQLALHTTEPAAAEAAAAAKSNTCNHLLHHCHILVYMAACWSPSIFCKRHVQFHRTKAPN